jgi:sugar phosphate isomerase/epimerase
MEERIANIISRCFVNIPLKEFDTYQPLIAKYRLNPEIGLEGDALYSFKKQDFHNQATFLFDRDLKCTLHAPFHDLQPGARDKFILQAVRDKLKRCFDLIEIFKPRSVVCHLGYLDCIHSYQFEEWLDTSIATWRELLLAAEFYDTPVMFENTYETGPRIHKTILETLDSPRARFCLDVGHLLAFTHSTWEEWLTILGPWLGQLHLHDNHGMQDEHLPVGKGNFDFRGLISYLKSNDFRPIITLEPRSEIDLWESLNALDRFALFDHKLG